ncbi:molecular chaperone DnaJ [Microbulbifer sp. 2304DJ12-6]|uniref:molecular chaperone DnaJ n=1 Tax=Microbulbifer sp. 2304DJ12-6 TaxID=3233340 RepID=UPI0039B03680
MARLILLFLILIAAWFAWQKIKSSAPGNRRKQIFLATVLGGAMIVVILALSGRLHWVGAAALLILPVLGRLLNQLPRILPWLSPLLQKYTHSRQSPGQQHQKAAQQPAGPPLTECEARRILGVGASAGRDEIVGAHRRLMQKLHPDRGGNDYLASRVNAAKELLLRIL